MQVCTSLQTDNDASTPPLSFLQAGCPSCRPTNSVKALKAANVNKIVTNQQYNYHQATAWHLQCYSNISITPHRSRSKNRSSIFIRRRQRAPIFNQLWFRGTLQSKKDRHLDRFSRSAMLLTRVNNKSASILLGSQHRRCPLAAALWRWRQILIEIRLL